jgi:hypothetical protein
MHPTRSMSQRCVVAEMCAETVYGPVMSALRVMENDVMSGRGSLGLRGGTSPRAVGLFSDAG